MENPLNPLSSENQPNSIKATAASLRSHFVLRRDEPELVAMDQTGSLVFKKLHEQERRAAAVLIPIIETLDGLDLLLTRRAEHLSSHPGQISFPGGFIEPQDRSVEAAALREAEEEVNLHPEQAEVLGRLGVFYTRYGVKITPVVALIKGELNLKPDPAEVAEVFRVPLDYLLNPQVYEMFHQEHLGEPLSYFSTKYQGYRIWGVTAGIIMGFYHEIKQSH